MTRAELIQAVARKLPKIHINDVDRVINATFDAIKDELSVGSEVNLIGFGKFHVKDRAEHQVRNPRTGELMKQPASKRVHFTTGKALREALNT